MGLKGMEWPESGIDSTSTSVRNCWRLPYTDVLLARQFLFITNRPARTRYVVTVRVRFPWCGMAPRKIILDAGRVCASDQPGTA